MRSAKYYLYFTQMGKCMYSGEPIDLSRLATDYDIDHIYPQSRVKDDSLSNRVLVKRKLNAEKTDTYPLSDAIRSRMTPFWSILKTRKLITEEKYRRLTRNTPFDDNELSGFIARQLVETSQACKIIAELLKNRYEGSDRVVYVKAGNVSSFRQDQRILPDGTQKQAGACKGIMTKQDPLFVKCREVNDFHHAKDAYLNIVVGNVYHTKFTRNPAVFIKKSQTYSLNRMFDYDVVRNGETAWRVGDDGSIATVRKTMSKNNILFTRYAYEVTGGLFKQQILPKGKGQAMIKSSDPRMNIKDYGGYDKVTGAYFMLVEHTEKKMHLRSIETVFLMNKTMYERDPISYCTGVLGLVEPSILIPKIKIDTLISYDGFRMSVASRSNDNIFYNNANQLILSCDWQQYIKEVAKCVKEGYLSREITNDKNVELYDLLLGKLENTLYSTVYETSIKHIKNHREQFVELVGYKQAGILMEIINLFRTTGLMANLKEIGAVKTGQISVTKRIGGIKNKRMYIINQSVTGFYEQKIDLLGDEF
ncbi:MAG: type II CRISPR RNA-guided endonuclease Cas9 [Clostridia bacterium]|nr:type II CRISPR RNA-guided endonuclease Cas9 [Clostridia bacterium]